MVRSQWPEVSRHLETAKIAALATEEALIWNYYTQEHRVNLHELYETIEPSLTRRLVAISLHARPNQLLFFNRSRPNEMCQNRKLTDQILKDRNKRGTQDHFEIWPLLMRPSHMNIILAWVNLMFRPGQYSISISRPRGLRDAKVRELSYSTYLHRHENRNRSTSSMSLKIPLKCDPQTSWRDTWQCMPGNYWRSLGISSQHARERRAMHRLVVKFQRHRRSYWTIANSNMTKS